MKDYNIEINQRVISAINFLIDNEKVVDKSELCNIFSIKPSKFSEIMSQRMSAGMDIIQNLCNKFNISAEWLLTGKGEMLKTDEPENIALPVSQNEPKAIPFYDGFAVGGKGGFTFALTQQDVKDYYVVPKFKDKKIDFMIEVTGSSMYPKYNSGDVVACTIISESTFIQWNKFHVIATREQGLLIKRLHQSKDTEKLTLVSDNKDYPPFDIPKEEICGIAIVAGVIRLE